ncbi:hypothetical protein DBR06_SOUSAS110325, partial [Sousa chinensis]
SMRTWVTGVLPPEQPGCWAGRALLCCFDFPALECFQCHRVNASGVCENRESFCHTQGSQQCFLRKVYEGDRFLYGYQGCGDLCLPMSFFRQNARVDFVCCSDSSFCNKL